MLLIILINCFIVTAVVVIHYEVLLQLALHLPKFNIRHRFKIVVGVIGALIAHAIEIWVFAVAYYLMHHAEGWGHLEGNVTGALIDFAYFSFTTYTTLGFGDIQPIGDIRYLTGIESLTGLVLITWSASFLYLEMQRYWNLK